MASDRADYDLEARVAAARAALDATASVLASVRLPTRFTTGADKARIRAAAATLARLADDEEMAIRRAGRVNGTKHP